MMAAVRHVTSGLGLKTVSSRLIFVGQRHAGCPHTVSLMKISNTCSRIPPKRKVTGVDISGMNFALRSSSDDDDNNNNTCLLINVVPFKVASLEIHTGSTVIARPFEALREVQ
jgi:hypothetical protein